MGGGGHAECPKVPDYRIYKVENVPELMQVKRALAAEGLKDPWLRNEVWRYHPSLTPRVVYRKTFGRGMAVGFGLAVLTTAVVAIVDKFGGDKDHGHH